MSALRRSSVVTRPGSLTAVQRDGVPAGISVRRLAHRYGDPPPEVPHEILVVSGSVEALVRSEESLRSLRQERPWAPLLLVVRGPTGLSGAMARLVHRVGARLPADGANPARDWWKCLRDPPPHFGEHIADWLRAVRPRLSRRPRLLARVARVVEGGRAGRALSEIAEALACSESGIRKSFRRSHLAPPSLFLRFGRVAPCLLAAVRRPDCSVERAAALAGYADGASFSRATVNLLRRRPGPLRSLPLTSEWLAAAAGLHTRQ